MDLGNDTAETNGADPCRTEFEKSGPNMYWYWLKFYMQQVHDDPLDKGCKRPSLKVRLACI